MLKNNRVLTVRVTFINNDAHFNITHNKTKWNSERKLHPSINLQRIHFSWITRKNDPNSTVQKL